MEKREKADEVIMDLLNRTLQLIEDLDYKAAAEAQTRLDNLIKPKGSLGKLENIAVQLAGMQSKSLPDMGKKVLVIMAAEHGVAEEGISSFPRDASPKMIHNFLNQRAAVNVLANHTHTRVLLVDVGLSGDLIDHPDLCLRRIKPGTGNICREAAMTESDAIAAIELGIELVNREIDDGAALIGTGEFGIGNTTSSTAIMACFSGKKIKDITGRGTGLDDVDLIKKQQIILRALELNQPDKEKPIDILAKVGGLEIAALTGVILGSAAKRVPVVLDGFVSGAAALLAAKMNQKSKQYLIAAHLSEEPGHRFLLDMLGLKPLLDIGLRIGEGTGAVLAFPLIEAAVNIINEMSTFAEVGVELNR